MGKLCSLHAVDFVKGMRKMKGKWFFIMELTAASLVAHSACADETVVPVEGKSGEVLSPPGSTPPSSATSSLSGMDDPAFATPPPMAGREAFVIRVTPEQGAIIDEIITTVGTLGVLELKGRRAYLKELGAKIHGIGMLNFFGYIFAGPNPVLATHMATIRRSVFKWNGFLDKDLIARLKAEKKSGELLPALPGFAAMIGADLRKMHLAAEKGKWKTFVASMLPKATASAVGAAKARRK